MLHRSSLDRIQAVGISSTTHIQISVILPQGLLLQRCPEHQEAQWAQADQGFLLYLKDQLDLGVPTRNKDCILDPRRKTSSRSFFDQRTISFWSCHIDFSYLFS